MSLVKVGFFFALARSSLFLETKCLFVVRMHLFWSLSSYWFRSKESMFSLGDTLIAMGKSTVSKGVEDIQARLRRTLLK